MAGVRMSILKHGRMLYARQVVLCIIRYEVWLSSFSALLSFALFLMLLAIKEYILLRSFRSAFQGSFSQFLLSDCIKVD